ncbi:DNA polymerase III subunit chi [Psychrobacter ciconiae]|uniref:DNA polymerase III subunit chi n=1 Tax=Psychrobacter ciconiae TaxID=1553449 RepID=UPI001917BA58|nr:DNA polymerase III subunit chi [Psychrobacter ciconiae]
MTPVAVSFYVLSETKAQGLLGFVCSLTQTVIEKSDLALIILSDDSAQLSQIDDALWDFEATSFIPHQIIDDRETSENSHANTATTSKNLLPRVLLSQALPNGFLGAVINLTPKALILNSETSLQNSASQNSNPSRILELVLPDDQSTVLGRQKYQSYQQQGCKLQHFKV